MALVLELYYAARWSQTVARLVFGLDVPALAFQSKVHQAGKEKMRFEFGTMSILSFLGKIKHSATEAWIKLNWTY